MTRILFYQNPDSTAPKWPPLRQTFLGRGFVFGERFEFVTDPGVDCDYLLAVADGQPPVVAQSIPRERRIAILMENPSIWTPPPEYLAHFGLLLAPAPLPTPTGTRLHLSQPAVGWFYGLAFRTDRGLSHEPILDDHLRLDDLALLPMPAKTRLLSCVVSAKGSTPGHRWRFEVATSLKQFFGDNIDMFGFGWNALADKRDALDPYLHTVVIENDCLDNYWTEKLADAILGYANPIYAGAPNVATFFRQPPAVLSHGAAPDDVVRQVAQAINTPVGTTDLYQRRHQIMYEHNLFYHVAALIREAII